MSLKERMNDSRPELVEAPSAMDVIANTKRRVPGEPVQPLAEKLQGFTDKRKQLVRKSVEADKAIAGIDTMRQIVYSAALIPGEISIKGHHITCEDIEYSAHNYLRNGAIVKSEHGMKGNTDPIDAHVVESFIAPQDLHFTGEGTPYGTQDIPKGSWVVGIKVNDPNEWAKVMSGEYTGFSTGGAAYVGAWEYGDE